MPQAVALAACSAFASLTGRHSRFLVSESEPATRRSRETTWYSRDGQGNRSGSGACADGAAKDETALLLRSWRPHAVRPKGIYFSTETGKKYSIDFFSFQTGRITPFYQETTPGFRINLAISPDGQWLLYSGAPPSESDLMLAENFHDRGED